MNTASSSTLNFDRALRVARRRGPIVLICLLIAAGSAFVFARREKKQYTASASVLFTNNQLAAVASGLTPPSSPLTQSQQDTNVKLVSIGDIAAKTAPLIGPNWNAAKVHAAISASADSDTNIVIVAATTPSPLVAQKLANTYAQNFVNEQQAAAVTSLTAAQKLVDAQYNALTSSQRASPQGLSLSDRSQSLGTLSKLENGNVTVVSTATRPTSPSAPKVSRDTALGAIVGLLIGLAIAFILERLDRRIRDPKELEHIYGWPLLAVVPERSRYRVLTSVGQLQQRAPDKGLLYDEVFNSLRSYLRYFAVDRDLQTLLIISAGPGEGKTTVSYNLAKAASALGSRVLLVEGDLRRGTTIGPLLTRPSPGLSDVLIGDAKMEEAIRSIEVGPKGVLDVLIAGVTPPPNATELTESRAMQGLLDDARASYDLVVIDTPPLNLIADAIPLLTKVDGVIVVGRVGRSRRDAAEQLRKKVTALRAPVLGIVANGARGRDNNRTGYEYGYGYGETTRATRNGSAPPAESRKPEDVPKTA